MRELILDDSLPRALAAELVARGRPARTVADLGLEGETDAAVAAAARDAVLVSTVPLSAPGPVAVIAARTPQGRRDAVHRHAHRIAAQRPGSLSRYPR